MARGLYWLLVFTAIQGRKYIFKALPKVYITLLDMQSNIYIYIYITIDPI